MADIFVLTGERDGVQMTWIDAPVRHKTRTVCIGRIEQRIKGNHAQRQPQVVVSGIYLGNQAEFDAWYAGITALKEQFEQKRAVWEQESPCKPESI